MEEAGQIDTCTMYHKLWSSLVHQRIAKKLSLHGDHSISSRQREKCEKTRKSLSAKLGINVKSALMVACSVSTSNQDFFSRLV